MILTYAGVRCEEVCQVGQKHTLDDGLRESHTSAQGVNIYGSEMKLRFPLPAQEKSSYYSSPLTTLTNTRDYTKIPKFISTALY